VPEQNGLKRQIVRLWNICRIAKKKRVPVQMCKRNLEGGAGRKNDAMNRELKWRKVGGMMPTPEM
jgi:hypothetical protein